MQIEHIQLTNFRGFGEVKVDLDAQLTVVVGVNGSGKTSLLEGLAVAAGAWLISFHDLLPRNLRPEDVRVLYHDLGELPTMEPQFPARVYARGDVHGRCAWMRELRSLRGKTTFGDAAELRAQATAAQNAVAKGEPVTLPVIAYYGAGRLWQQRYQSEKKVDGLSSRTQGYVDCLDAMSNHKLFEAWMRQLAEVHLQQIAAAPSAAPPLPSTLSAVNAVVAKMVDGAVGLRYDVRWRRLRVDYADSDPKPFQVLSDGYRNLIATAADLAWRAVQLNPHLGTDAPREARGIVLIDEIELHLHPAWQRDVLTRLTNAFPNLQFVVTTHSPVVIGSVPAHQIRLLDTHGAVSPVNVSEGLSANQVLRQLMGVAERGDATTMALRDLASLIEQGNSPDAQSLYLALHRQLGDHDPDLATLAWELRDLEAQNAADP